MIQKRQPRRSSDGSASSFSFSVSFSVRDEAGETEGGGDMVVAARRAGQPAPSQIAQNAAAKGRYRAEQDSCFSTRCHQRARTDSSLFGCRKGEQRRTGQSAPEPPSAPTRPGFHLLLSKCEACWPAISAVGGGSSLRVTRARFQRGASIPEHACSLQNHADVRANIYRSSSACFQAGD